MSGMRGTISRRMLQSLQLTAQMTALAQWDLTNLMELRARLNQAADTLGFRATVPGLMVFFLARVLKEMPLFNASIVGNEVHYWEDVNIGVAVAVADGLVVPVVHGADRMSLKDIQTILADLIERARSKKLLPDDMAGGTFTLSNLGSYGSEYETVILNPPEVALLGIGKSEKKPVVINDEIVIREMMPVSLTFDHRLIDGATAGAFRQRLRQLVEQPGMLVACPHFGF
jgi:pyruvate/2-oxoglutarate dehydrogenase complex dihydrolipoamide acyltransferase (E2) component